jgi:integrase
MAGQIIARGKGVWLVRVFLGREPATGKRAYLNKTIHGNKKDAEAYLAESLRERDLGGTVPSKATVNSLLDALLLDYKVNRKSYAWAEIVVRCHLRPYFGELPIPKVGTTTVQRFIAARQEEGAANATINRDLALLRRAFHLGHDSTPPRVARVPKIPELREDNVRAGFFEHEAFLKIRAGMPEFWARLAVTFAYFTGCRRGEVLPLGWDQVDLLERVVRLEATDTKNREARLIPLAPELSELLAIEKATRDQEYPSCPWVLSRGGQPIRSHDLRDAWARASKVAGFTDQAGKPTRLFHDLRRTGVRNLIRAGVPERVAMSISGHKTRAVFDRYNIVSEADLKDAARRLGEYLAHKGAELEDRHTIGTQAHPGPIQ